MNTSHAPSPDTAAAAVPLSRVLLLCVLLTVFALGMAGQLFVFKYEGAVGDIRQSRMALIAGELQQIIEKGVAVGVMPADSTTLPEAVRSRLASDSLIQGIEIIDADQRKLLSEGRGDTEGGVPLTVVARNSFGLELARVTLIYDGKPLVRQMWAFGREILVVGLGLALVSTLLGALGVVVLRRRGHSEKFALVGILPWLVGGVLVLGGITYEKLRSDMSPEFIAKARVVGSSSVGLFHLALEQGVTLEQIPGVVSYFDGLRQTTPAFADIAVHVGDKVLHRSGQPRGGEELSLPITSGEAELGQLRVGIDPAAVSAVLKDMALDLVTVIVVAGFLAVELFRFLFVPSSAVVRQSEGDGISLEVMALRAPVFLLFLAEDLTRSFLPVYTGALPPGALFSTLGITLSAKAMAGLPVILFMLLVALAQPFLGVVVNRFGVRKLLIGAAIGGALSHGLAAGADTASALLLTRVLAAIAWAVAFATAQAVVLDSMSRQQRATGVAYFVGIIMSASICGPSIGGILADSIGYRGTLYTALVLSLLAAILMRKVGAGGTASTTDAPQADSAADSAVAPASATGSALALLTNLRFTQLLLLAAIPAKLILIGFCFYLVPVYISDWGGSAADAGRIQMIYSLAMVLAVPWFARSAVPGVQAKRVAIGLVISGLSGLALLWPNLAMVAVMALVLGIGQSISIAAQAALVGEVCAKQIATRGDAEVYGVYRLLERLGNALGPAAAAALAAMLGASGAFAAMGVAVAAGGLLFGRLFGVRWREAK